MIYLIIGVIRRQLNMEDLNDKHIYVAVEISKINYGRASTAHYFFVNQSKKIKDRKMCTVDELNKMKVGDIYLAKFNIENEFSLLMCGCKLSNSDKGKVWQSFKDCN